MAKESLSKVDVEAEPSGFLEAMFSMLDDIREGNPAEPGRFTRITANYLGDLDNPDRFEALIQSGFFETLVKLYNTHNTRRPCNDYIRYLLQMITAPQLTTCLDQRASVLLRLCLCMSSTESSRFDDLYVLTTRRLRHLAQKGNYQLHFQCKMDPISDLVLIIHDLLYRLSHDLDLCTDAPSNREKSGLFFNDFRDFKAISRLLCRVIQDQESKPSPVSEHDCERKVDSLYCVFNGLMTKMKEKLVVLQSDRSSEGKINDLTEEGQINEENVRPEWSLYLAILEELNFISKIYEGAEEIFWNILEETKISVRALILRFTNATDDCKYEWLLEHNEVTDSESRMHLALLMIPQVKEPQIELIQELVDWSLNLDTDLYGVFKTKKLTDSQVLQDWLCRSREAIFNSRRNPIFLECKDDPSRFYMNHELKPEPFHYKCVEFAGKVIALALIYKVRIGVGLDTGFLSELIDLNDSSLDGRCDDTVLVPFFAKGFANVFGVSLKELLSFRGLEIEDINKVLHKPPSNHHHSGDDSNGKEMREADPREVASGDLAGVLSGPSLLLPRFAAGWWVRFSGQLPAAGASLGWLSAIFRSFSGGLGAAAPSSTGCATYLADPDPLLRQYQRVRKEGRRIKNWQRGPKLGNGCYGEVYQGLADVGFFFAAKRVPLADREKVSSIEKEIALLCQFDHENIVGYFGTKTEGTDLYIFLEFVSGSSIDKVYKEFTLDYFQVSRYTKQILEGLKYLHDRNVMHGDIKCANVLLNEDGIVKIADFGLATTNGIKSTLRKLGKSPSVWSTPEASNIQMKEDYGLKADIWNLGCTILEMLTKEYPNSFPPTIPNTLSVDSRNFIQNCLQVKPEERPTAAQLLLHPFVKGC